MEEYGFADALRHMYPDEVENLAFTWPVEEVLDPISCPGFHKDRIDFVYVRGTGTNVLDAAVVNEELSCMQSVSVRPQGCCCDDSLMGKGGEEILGNIRGEGGEN